MFIFSYWPWNENCPVRLLRDILSVSFPLISGNTFFLLMPHSNKGPHSRFSLGFDQYPSLHCGAKSLTLRRIITMEHKRIYFYFHSASVQPQETPSNGWTSLTTAIFNITVVLWRCLHSSLFSAVHLMVFSKAAVHQHWASLDADHPVEKSHFPSWTTPILQSPYFLSD